MRTKKETELLPDQIVPLLLTAAVFFFVCLALFGEITVLNKFVVSREKISLRLNLSDIIVGLTIYLKTSIDFAIFIGRLMTSAPGWKNRIMIEIGTALGNALGTLSILLVWDLFREIRPLMALMIILAALVLFRLAEEGLDHVKNEKGVYQIYFFGLPAHFERILFSFNRRLAPVLNKIVPHAALKIGQIKGYRQLFIISLSIPFILGLDDFAGYIPLFNIVNVFGFAVGVFLGHMILNALLFLSPLRTIAAVKHPVISFLGSLAFVGLGIWGLIEAFRLLIH